MLPCPDRWTRGHVSPPEVVVPAAVGTSVAVAELVGVAGGEVGVASATVFADALAGRAG